MPDQHEPQQPDLDAEPATRDLSAGLVPPAGRPVGAGPTVRLRPPPDDTDEPTLVTPPPGSPAAHPAPPDGDPTPLRASGHTAASPDSARPTASADEPTVVTAAPSVPHPPPSGVVAEGEPTVVTAPPSGVVAEGEPTVVTALRASAGPHPGAPADPPAEQPARTAHPSAEQPARAAQSPETTPADPGTPPGPTGSDLAPAEPARPVKATGEPGDPTGTAPADSADSNSGPGVSPDQVNLSDHPTPARLSSGRRLSSAGALIWLLLALFGFTLVVQLSSNDTDEGLTGARQEDLVRILSDLEARDTRLQAEIAALETSQRRLTSGVQGRQAALAEAQKRADELGLLAGTVAGRGPGLRIGLDRVKASAILNAVQELRGAGGEVMELVGASGQSVRIVASTFFVDAGDGAILVDGERLTGPYTLWVIGVPQTMQTALQIPGGVVASVHSDGGSVTMEQRTLVEVTAVREATSLRYARPVS